MVLGLLCLIAIVALRLELLAAVLALLMLVAAFDRQVLAWPSLIAALIVLILIIPIRRYTLPVNVGGFELEPYRVLVAFIVVGWIAALLVDPRVRLRRTGLEAPIAAIWIAILASIFVNFDRISEFGVETNVVKSITFLLSFFVVLYVISSVVSSSAAMRLVKVLVAVGSLVAVLAVIESRTGKNAFNGFGWVPFLRENVLPNPEADVTGFTRGDRLRTYASAEHPIALAAALAMLVPVALALALSGSRRWFAAAAVLTLGTLSTVSRTGVVMLAVIGLVFLWLRPLRTIQMWWALIPLLFVIHASLPNTIGVLKSSFFPPGDLLQEQRSSATSRTAGGRVADLAPTLNEVSRSPFLGVGFGSQVVEPPGVSQPKNPPEVPLPEAAKARILDNQWLGLLLEVGMLGLLAWAWFFAGFIRRAARAAKEDHSDRGWMLVGLTAAVFAYAIGMLTFDAFAFVQSVFILFILVAFGTVLLRVRPQPAAREPEREQPPPTIELPTAGGLSRA